MEERRRGKGRVEQLRKEERLETVRDEGREGEGKKRRKEGWIDEMKDDGRKNKRKDMKEEESNLFSVGKILKDPWREGTKRGNK